MFARSGQFAHSRSVRTLRGARKWPLINLEQTMEPIAWSPHHIARWRAPLFGFHMRRMCDGWYTPWPSHLHPMRSHLICRDKTVDRYKIIKHCIYARPADRPTCSRARGTLFSLSDKVCVLAPTTTSTIYRWATWRHTEPTFCRAARQLQICNRQLRL